MLHRLNLASRIVALVVASVFVTAAGMWFATSTELSRQLEAREFDASQDQIRALAVVFGDRVFGSRVVIEDGEVRKAESPNLGAFSDHSVVDTTTTLTGGVATVFAFDPEANNFIRRSTTVRREDGERAVGTYLADNHPAQAVVRAGQTYFGPATLFGRDFTTVYQPTVDPSNGRVNGILFVGMPIEGLAEAKASANNAMLIAALVLAALVTGASAFLAKRLFAPLNQITKRVQTLAEGDLDTAIPHRTRGDEIGGVARALETLRETSVVARRMQEERESSQGEALRVRAQRDAAIAEFRDAAAARLRELTGNMAALRQRAEDMTGIAAESAEAISGATGGSQETATNVATVASAAEELSASITEISGQLERARNLVEQGLSDTETTNAEIAGLAEAAQRIGDVVDLIRSIADQTNLLALNATIEAARAGEAGKGFAVVAAEVKTLATQTANATEEIAKQIAGIQSSTGSAVDAIAQITERMRAINGATVTIASAMTQQGAATAEISRNVQHAAQGTENISGGLGQVARAAERTSEAANGVRGAAGTAERLASDLEREIETFLSRVA